MATIVGNLDINTAPAMRSVAELKSTLKSVDNIVVPVKADTTGATSALNNFSKTGAAHGVNLGTSLKDGLRSSLSGAGGIGSILAGGLGGGAVGGIAVAATAVISGLKSVVDIGSEFETALQSVSAVTGVTGPALTDLGNRSRELAKTFGGDAKSQLAGFQTLLSKFGVDLAKYPDQLSEVTKNVNLLGKASGLDAQQSVSALANAMLQFGVTAEDPIKLAKESARFVNVLAASAKEGAAEIPQLTDAILQAGPTARQLGLSIESTSAAVQALAVGGKEGSEAGIGLRNTMLALVKPTKEGEDALAKIGISSTDLAKTLSGQGLPAALEKLKGGFDKLPDASEKAALSTLLFGRENVASAGILLSNIDLMKQYEERSTGTSVALEAAAANMATFSEGMSRIGAFFSDIAIGAFLEIKNFVAFLSARVGPPIMAALTSIGGQFERLWSVVKPILLGVGAYFVTAFVTNINTASAIVTIFSTVASQVFDSLKRTLQPLLNIFSNLFGEVGKGGDIMTSFAAVLDGITAAFTYLVGIITNVTSIFIDLASLGIDVVVASVAPLYQGLVDIGKALFGMSGSTESATSFFTDLGNAFQSFSTATIILRGAFSELRTMVVDLVKAWNNFDISGVIKIFTGGLDRLKKAGLDAVNEDKKAKAAIVESDKKAAADKAAADLAAVTAEEKAAKEKAAKEKAAREKAAREKAAADKAAADVQKPTELEAALKIYKEIEKSVSARADQERTQIDILTKRGQLTKEEAAVKLKGIDEREAGELFAVVQRILKIKSDQLGLFVSTGIKLNEDETDNELRSITNKLAAKLPFEVPARLVVKVDLVKPLVDELSAAAQFIDKISNDMSDSFVDSLGKVNIADLVLPQKDTDKINKRIDEIRKNLVAGVTSYQQAMKDIGTVVSSTTSFVDRLRTSLSVVFTQEFESNRNNLAQSLRLQQQLLQRRRNAFTDEFASEQDRAKAIKEIDDELLKSKQNIYNAIGRASADVTALLFVDAKAAGKSVKSLAVETAGGLLQLYLAPIIASFLAFLGPFAAPLAAIAIAAIKGVFGAAINSFSKGGPTGGREGEVRGVVHGGEWVARPEVYARNKDLLDSLDRGFIAPRVASNGGAHNITFDNIRNDEIISSLKKTNMYLSKMSTSHLSRSAVSLDVGFDNFLYERARHRTAVRNLR